MPFCDLTSAQFNLETLAIMQRAFDAACSSLRLAVDDPKRSKLAAAIIRLVSDGERSKLAEKAVAEMLTAWTSAE